MYRGESEVGVGDCVLLSEITMDKFKENLRERHKVGKIYTYIGEVCINVNPYRRVQKLNIECTEDHKVLITEQAPREMVIFLS